VSAQARQTYAKFHHKIMPKQSAEPLTPKKIGKYQHLFNHVWTDDELTDLADDLFEYFKEKSNYFIMDFMNDERRLISRQNISNFCNRHPYFAQIYAKCKEIQERRMMLLSIQSDKPTAWIFALKNCAGWRDNPEVNDDIDEENNLTFEGWK
jgi:hypothetical protein